MGQLVMLVHHAGRPGLGRSVVELASEVPAGGEATGADPLRKLDVGQLQADSRLVVEPERVVGAAEQAAALADDALEPLVERVAEDDVGRERTASLVQPADDRAGARLQGAGGGLSAEIDGAGIAAGQGDRAGDAVVVRLVVQGSQQGEPVRPTRQARQELADLDARHRRCDRLERATVFEGGAGLEVEGIEVARSTPEPEHDDRPRRCCAAVLEVLRLRPEGEQVAERQAEGAEATNLEERSSRY